VTAAAGFEDYGWSACPGTVDVEGTAADIDRPTHSESVLTVLPMTDLFIADA
jgi:hypothetical protein